MLTTVFFDLDATLVDFGPDAWRATVRAVCARLAPATPPGAPSSDAPRPADTEVRAAARPASTEALDAARSGGAADRGAGRAGGGDAWVAERSGDAPDLATARAGGAARGDAGRSGVGEELDARRPGAAPGLATARSGGAAGLDAARLAEAYVARYVARARAAGPGSPHPRGAIPSARATWLALWRAALAECGYPELAETAVDAYIEQRHRDYARYDDVLDALRDLRAAGRRIGVITNGPGDAQRAKIAATGLGPYLDMVVVSGEVETSKPGREIFDLALARAGTTAAEACHVGDSLAADVAGARAAGLGAAIWLDRTATAEAASTEAIRADAAPGAGHRRGAARAEAASAEAARADGAPGAGHRRGAGRAGTDSGWYRIGTLRALPRLLRELDGR